MFYKKIKNNNNGACPAELQRSGGFTLLELLVVIAIIGILTAISVGNYSKFTNDVVLTNMAYELALSIREAQVYGISVSNQRGGSFGDRYGIYFNKGESSYLLFVDFEAIEGWNGVYDSNNDLLKKTYTLQKGVVVNDLKLCSSTNSLDGLSVTFKRPNPEPIVEGYDAGTKTAQIELESREGTKKYVIVSGNGQIYVTSTPC